MVRRTRFDAPAPRRAQGATLFTICQFRAFMTPEQLKRTDALIAETGITVYSYPFANRYLVGEGENIAVIFEYAVGDTVIPNIRDAIGGDICVADIADASMTDSCFRPFATGSSERGATTGITPFPAR